MKHENRRVLLPVLLLLISLSACSSSGSGGSSDSDSDGAAVSEVSDLPTSVAPVVDGDVSTPTLMIAGSKALATTGMPLGTTNDESFSENSSVASCEMFNQTKHALSSAVQGDLVLCYIQNTLAAMDREDLFDGDYHVIGLSFEGSDFEDDGQGPSKVKFKVVKDADGNITEFEMFACEGESQNEYLSQTISGQDFTMISKNGHSSEDFEFASSVEVTGKLNSDGSFVDEVDGAATPKTINMTFTNTNNFGGGDNEFTGVMTFEQFSDEARMTGYMNGTHSFEFFNPLSDDVETVDCSFTNNLYGAMQLLDANVDGEEYNVNLLALGDGAVTGAFSGGCGGETWEDTFVEGWLGDDTSVVDPASDSDFYDAVVDQALSTPTVGTTAFTGDEVYSGCADDTDIEETVRFADLSVNIMEECSNLEVDHQHIECWQIVNEGRGGGNEGEGGGPE